MLFSVHHHHQDWIVDTQEHSYPGPRIIIHALEFDRLLDVRA